MAAPTVSTGSARHDFRPLPASVRAVLANRLFVEKEGLPSPLLSQLKRVAAFQNPEFYKKQGMRLSTAGTPRVIGCAEDFPNHLALPRCCLGEVQELFADYAVQVDLEDQRNEGKRCAWTFQGDLTPVQAAAARALSRHDSGLFVAPPGTGKTVLGAWLVAKRARSTLILVHRANLLDQWVAQLSIFLGVDPRDVGQVGGGKRKPNGRLDVAMFQSLVRKEGVDDLVAGYGHVLVDECHHAAASSYERLLAEVKARYVVGLTATPQRRDGLHPLVEMQLGPVRYTAAPQAAADRPVAHRLLVRPTSFRLPGGEQPIQQIYGAMVQDEARNSLVLQDLLRELDEGRSPLLLTERRDHLDWFAERLRDRVPHLVVLQGGRQIKARQELEARLEAVPAQEGLVLLATGRYVGEGFDYPRLDTLLLSMPVSWKGTVIQYSGRLHRLHPGKSEVRVYDYVDREVPMLLRMFEKRLRTWRAIGYARSEAPLGLAETEEDVPELEREGG